MAVLFFLFLLALIAVIYLRIDRSRSYVKSNPIQSKVKQKYMFKDKGTAPAVFGPLYNASSLRLKNNRNKKKIDKAYQR